MTVSRKPLFTARPGLIRRCSAQAGRRASLAAALLLAVGTGSAAPPVAAAADAPTPIIATVQADTPIAGGAGWVLWSVPVAGGWGLRGEHAGAVHTFPVAPRAQPFDVAVGTGSGGQATAVYSRCATAPARPPLGLELVAPLTGNGCRIAQLDLTTGQETLPPVPHPAGTSDTTPAVAHGKIAFGRLNPKHFGQVEQVLLWTPGKSTLRRLPTGPLPHGCTSSGHCRGQIGSGSIGRLAYDGKLASFLWQPVAPGVAYDAAWEVRADTVASGKSALVGGGYVGEACGGGVDSSEPTAPVLSGSTVTYGSLSSSCYALSSSLTQVTASDASHGRAGALPGAVIDLALDHGALYALTAAQPSSQTAPSCSVATPCTITQVAAPALSPVKHKPASPFF
jgi:hypothetical protein